MQKTVKCKLEPTPAQANALLDTMTAFAAACNDALAMAKETGHHRPYALQPECYHQIKERTGLTANYVVRAIARVGSAFGKGKEPPKGFRPTSLDLDARVMDYRPQDELVSVSTIEGRMKIRVRLGDYQRQQLGKQKPKSGKITFDEQKKRCSIHFVINVDEPEPSGENSFGVDRGIKRIASTSEGQHYSGRRLNRTRERYVRTRASLQRAKAQRPNGNAYRVLKRLSGRERRFQTHINHIISKQIVQRAKETNSYIVLEELKGIRQRTANKGKAHRSRMGRWAFYQLMTFIIYKAALAGVPVIFISPAYTSRHCSRCGSFGSRHSLKFSCASCGLVLDADFNAALNIAAQGRRVNTPAKLA